MSEVYEPLRNRLLDRYDMEARKQGWEIRYNYRICMGFLRNAYVADPREILRVDVDKYLAERKAQGASVATLRRERGAIRDFYDFLRDFLDEPIPNPAELPPRSRWLELVASRALGTSESVPQDSAGNTQPSPGHSQEHDTPAK